MNLEFILYFISILLSDKELFWLLDNDLDEYMCLCELYEVRLFLVEDDFVYNGFFFL